MPLQGLLLGIAVLAASQTAAANEPKISIAPLVKAEVAGQTDFYVHVDWQAKPMPPNGMLIVVGLPKAVTFSAGSAAGGLWELPLTGLDKLKLMVPPIEPQRVNLSFYLVNKQQSGIVILASTRSILSIESSAPAQTAASSPNEVKKVEKSGTAALDGTPSSGTAGGAEKQPPVASRDPKTKEAPAAKEAAKAPTAEERVGEASKALEDARAKVASKRAEAERLTAEAAKVDEARRAEEARIEEARRLIAARQAEAERLAAEAAKVEQARKTEEARIEEARRQVAARQAEAERLAAEAAKAEEARKAEVARVEEARRQAAAKQAEAERVAAEATKIEEARKAEVAKVEEARRQVAIQKAEAAKLTAEAAKVEEARKAEEARMEEARRQALAKARPEPERRTEIEKVKGSPEVAAVEKPAPGPAKSPDAEVASTKGDHAREQQVLPAQLERLVKKGDEYLSQGNIAIAREYFLRASRAGVAAAALKLAETYDPHELGRMGVHGLVPNITEAKRWYLRALELGSHEATIRLSRLGD